MLRQPKVLLFSTDEAEMAQLQQILSEHVILTPVDHQSKLNALIEKHNYDALFCAWSLQQGSWNDVVSEVRESHPDLPVIVLSPAPDNREWDEVLQAGAFDLLVPPFEERSMLAVLEQASASREAVASRYREPHLNFGA